MDKVLELNQILDEEISFCENFEELLSQKKESLIHSKPATLKSYDEKIYLAQKQLVELKTKRAEVTKKFGNSETKLSDIIKNIEDKRIAYELELKRKKLQVFAQKISIINKVINSLIEHSLKMIDGTIVSIANALSKAENEADYYNVHGEIQTQHNIMSAIVEDA